VEVHLLDGTYELFRHYFAVPSRISEDGLEIAATRAVVGSVLNMVEAGATHLGIATDQVIESFRNKMFAGYKTGENVPSDLLAQFPLMEEALGAAGFVVFPMVHYEADDALAAAAVKAAEDSRVCRVLVCTPDKDLAQVVDDGLRIVQFDRRKEVLYDRDGVIRRFGVLPESIPDYLALVGDTADGIPGLPGWGAKSSSTILSQFVHLEAIPNSFEEWNLELRGAARLASALTSGRERAMLYRQLATLDVEAPVMESVDDLRWTGPQPNFAEVLEKLDAPRLLDRAERLAGIRTES